MGSGNNDQKREEALNMKLIKPDIEIIDMKDYEQIIKKIEKIGRVCYKSEDRIKEDSA